MRTNLKLGGALAVAAVVAAGGSAYTATSTIDHSTKVVGTTAQTISGVDVSNVAYTWDAPTDATSAVAFTIGAALGANDTISVTLNNTAGECTKDAPGLVYTCTWASPVVNATDLSIVVN